MNGGKIVEAKTGLLQASSRNKRLAGGIDDQIA
jgi:hypothetical protein